LNKRASERHGEYFYFSEVILRVECNNGAFAAGFLGTTPLKLEQIFASFGIKCRDYISPTSFVSDFANQYNEGDADCIVSY
jgi:hypothetical protein